MFFSGKSISRICKKKMDRISSLPDDLLVRILSLLPSTKAAVSTCILSKRWQFLWLWLPILEYHSRPSSPSECEMLRRFLNRNMPLHRAPVIEAFCLYISGREFKTEDIDQWVRTAISRELQKLRIFYFGEDLLEFPLELYTSTSLVDLRFWGVTLRDIPSVAHLPALKTLHVRCSHATEKAFQTLLSICPILEVLVVRFEEPLDGMRRFSIVVPTLQTLKLRISPDLELDGYVIDTPSLQYFKLKDYGVSRQNSLFKNMPKLLEADIVVLDDSIHTRLIGSITSVERLTISVRAGYGSFVFNNLQYLDLSLLNPCSLNIMFQFLQDSPKLQEIEISTFAYYRRDFYRAYNERWNQPTTVPQCLLSSLQILRWAPNYGTAQEIASVVYILENARHLQKATVLVRTTDLSTAEQINIVDLLVSTRSTCPNIFVGDNDRHPPPPTTSDLNI